MADQQRSSLVPAVVAGLVGIVAGYGLHSVTHRGGGGSDESGAPILVNKVAIPREQYVRRLEMASGRTALQQAVDDQIAIQFADKQGVPATAEQVDAKYAEMSKQEGFADNLKKSLQTPEGVKDSLRAQIARENVLTKGIALTDAEVQDFYKRNSDKSNPQARFYQPETVQIAAILTADEASSKAAVADLARSIPFAQVAAKYSQDMSKQNGGVLPPIQKGRWDRSKMPGLEEMVMVMKPGDQRGPVQIAGRWWVIRCLAHEPEKALPFDTVKQEAANLAKLEAGVKKNGQTMESEFAKFKQESKIDTEIDRYKPLLDKK